MNTPKTARRVLLGGFLAAACGIGLVLSLGTTESTAQPPKADAPKGGPSDHVMFGGTHDRNMVNLQDKGLKLPTAIPKWDNEEEIKKWSAEWVLWKADLGSRSYSGPIIAGGKVFVGTNNERPRNPRDSQKDAGEIKPIDKCCLYCFDEKSGKFLWQLVFDKLPSGQVNDWPFEGLCSTPTVEGDKVYFVSNRCTVVCADVNGLANGNQGFQGEKYKDPTDGDIIWEYDMIGEL